MNGEEQVIARCFENSAVGIEAISKYFQTQKIKACPDSESQN
jgi:hypothetical protein